MPKTTCKTVIEKLSKIIDKYGDLDVVLLDFDDDSENVEIYEIEPFVVKHPHNDEKFVVIFDIF